MSGPDMTRSDLEGPDLAPVPDEVELPPESPSTLGLWGLVLAGPVVWIAHFGTVYLAAEAACAALDQPGFAFVGEGGLLAVVAGATVVAALACAAVAGIAVRRARRTRGDAAALVWAAVIGAAGSLLAVLVVGLPAFALGPC